MIWKTLSSGAILLAANFGYAARIELQFANDNEREVWVLASKPMKMPLGGQIFKSAKFAVNVPDTIKNGFIVVAESSSGNVAIRMASEIKGVWNVQPNEWRVGQVVVNAYSMGNPIPEGTVEAAVGDYNEQREIENGKAEFFAAPAKEAQFIVHYTSGGAKKKSAPQIMKLSLKRADKVPSLAITVTDPVDNAGQPSKPKSGQKNEGSGIANVFVWLLGLAVAATVFWFLFSQIRKNEAVVAERLRKIGVQIPGEQQPGDDDTAVISTPPFQAPPIVPAGHCQFCGEPLRPDGTCACRPGGPQTAAVSSLAAPQLVSDSQTIAIPETGVMLGREGDVVIADGTVSRKHAQIKNSNGRVTIADLGSSNGTYVNGAKINSEVVLERGDTVQLGAVKFWFEV